MKGKVLQIIFLVAIAGVALFLINKMSFNTPAQEPNNIRQSPTPQPITNPDVIVDTPQPNDLVTSPLVVKGRAMNTWYFEANIPVTLKDMTGNVLAKKGFQAQSDWMTAGYVGFSDTLTFSNPQTQYGVLLIGKDNPSGDPARDDDFPVSVRFW